MKKQIFLVLIFMIFMSLGFVSSQGVSGDKIKNPLEKSNQILEKEIVVPEELQFLAGFLFGYKTGEADITFQLFVILIALWIIVFLFLRDVVKIIPFFEGAKSWIASLTILLLVGISGGLKLVAGWIFVISKASQFPKGLAFFAFFLSLAIIFGIYFLLRYFLIPLKSQAEVESLRIAGNRIGVASEFGKIQANTMKRNS